MRKSFPIRVLSIVAVLWMTLLGPAVAQQDPLALLSGYIGQWRGEGALVGGDRNEPFRCRLTVAQGAANKINYSGRCSLVNSNLSINGTIAYNSDKSQFEAVMSSNAGYSGLAVGRESRGRIDFDLREQQRDRAGGDVRIGAAIVLVGGAITVNFEVEFNDSGEVLTAAVPFSK